MDQADAVPAPVTGRGPRRRVLSAALSVLGIGALLGVGLWQAGGQLAWSSASRRPSLVTGPVPQSALLRPAAWVIQSGSPLQRTLRRAADSAARELAGSGDSSKVSWDQRTGLWDQLVPPVGAPASWQPPMWWQSALALRSLLRFITVTHDTQPAYQRLIADVYRLNVSRPGSLQPAKFENKFMDDTAWWGLTWLAAFEYERTVKHDGRAAGRYLALAETDAAYVYAQRGTCHSQGIAFKPGYAPNTITNAEFVSLAAQLAQARGVSGRFRNAAKRQLWLTDATGVLRWLEGSGLVRMDAGTVVATYTGQCRPAGKAQTYTEGEMADALTQMGTALHQRSYYSQAAVFFNHALMASSPMLAGGVLQEPCEAQTGSCLGRSYNITVFKGLFTNAVADWEAATGSARYNPFLSAQAQAVLANSNGSGGKRACQTPASCQLSMYWARRVPRARAPIPPTPGSQAAGLSALGDALVTTDNSRKRIWTDLPQLRVSIARNQKSGRFRERTEHQRA